MTLSAPSTSSPPHSKHVQRTNTLAVTGLLKSFFHPAVLEALRNHFASYGEINQWVPLSGFGRILVVYESEDAAESAKQYSPIILDGTDGRPSTILNVYRADPNPLITPDFSMSYLRPPPIEKNFLISPPGSPPIGWEPIKEDPPNAAPLADDLIVALQKLQMHHRRSSTLEVLMDPQDGPGVGVYVEDCDGDEDRDPSEEEWVYGEPSPARARWRPVATALPPMRSVMT